MKAIFIRSHTENIAKDIVTFWFEPEKPVNQIAGQYIEMTLLHNNPDSRGQKRWFTLSNSPTDTPLISITTRLASSNGSSFKTTLKNLEQGSEVLINEPMGDFVLPKDSTIPLVFVAGGIGITPFHSIIKFLYDTKQSRDITFIYGARDEHDLVFQDLFEKYGLKRNIVLSKPIGSWDGETGQLNGKRIMELAKPKDESFIYISGPEAMVETLNTELEEIGISKTRLVGDFFPGYS